MEQPTTEKHWIVFCFNFLTLFSGWHTLISDQRSDGTKCGCPPFMLQYESHSIVSDSLRHYGFTVREILQDRKLAWVALPFSRGSSQPRDRAQIFYITSGFFTSWTTGEAHINDQNPPLSALECVIAEVKYLIGGWWDGVYMVWFPVWSFFHCIKVPSILQTV